MIAPKPAPEYLDIFCHVYVSVEVFPLQIGAVEYHIRMRAVLFGDRNGAGVHIKIAAVICAGGNVGVAVEEDGALLHGG